MIPATRSEALAVLVELRVVTPDVWFSHVFTHLGFLGEDQSGRSLWDIDDVSPQ